MGIILHPLLGGKGLHMSTGLARWMEQERVIPSRMITASKEADPEGRGFSRRTMYNARSSGDMSQRVLFLMLRTSQILHQRGAASRTLVLRDFDRWGILASP